MELERKYAEYAAEQAIELLNIDSPSGFTNKAASWVLDSFNNLGFKAKLTNKGAVLVDLGGKLLRFLRSLRGVLIVRFAVH